MERFRDIGLSGTGRGGESGPLDTLSVRMSNQTATKTAPIPATTSHSARVRSALWAAWGDALGFPAEMASAGMLQRRLDSVEPDGLPGPWPRKVGGRMGPIIQLPAGCTSDDTQLRLAVARCVRASGRFDAEAFSKIELPVFLSYQLGAGRGTRAASHSLSRRTTRWFSNFFDDRGSEYINGGGNGAAMRIQPHVWAARDARPETYLSPMLRDVVCTHGHPRAILGAYLHALALGTAIHQGEIPDPGRWPAMVDHLRQVDETIASDDVLADRWLPIWQKTAGRRFTDAVEETVAELKHQIELAVDAARRLRKGNGGGRTYSELAKSLGGLNPETRGAGTITAVLSLWLAWASSDEPVGGLQTSAGLLNSDTDTVSTMAGAIVGAITATDPPGELLDRELIINEAKRLEALSEGKSAPSFPHPDPLHWQPPPSLSDALGLLNNRPAVAGLGPVNLVGEPVRGEGDRGGFWQWALTDYGQSLLIKRRQKLHELPIGAQPRIRQSAAPSNGNGGPLREVSSDESEFPADPEQGAELFLSRQDDDRLLGLLLRHYASQGATQAAVFATLISSKLLKR